MTLQVASRLSWMRNLNISSVICNFTVVGMLQKSLRFSE